MARLARYMALYKSYILLLLLLHVFYFDHARFQCDPEALYSSGQNVDGFNLGLKCNGMRVEFMMGLWPDLPKGQNRK